MALYTVIDTNWENTHGVRPLGKASPTPTFPKAKTPRFHGEKPAIEVYAPVVQKSMEHSTQIEAEV